LKLLLEEARVLRIDGELNPFPFVQDDHVAPLVHRVEETTVLTDVFDFLFHRYLSQLMVLHSEAEMQYAATLIGIYSCKVVIEASSPQEAEEKLLKAKSTSDFTRIGSKIEFLKTDSVEDVSPSQLEID
jgi:hypothetical protein